MGETQKSLKTILIRLLVEVDYVVSVPMANTPVSSAL